MIEKHEKGLSILSNELSKLISQSENVISELKEVAYDLI